MTPPPIVATPSTPKYNDLNKLEYTLRVLPHWFKHFSPISFWEDFKRFICIYSFVKIWHPFVAPPYPWGYWIEHTWIYTTSGFFNTNKSVSGKSVNKSRRFLKINVLYSNVKIRPPPYCGLCLPLWIMNWTNLNIHYLGILPHELQLFWLISFWEKTF